jgi:hypothetical protein
MKVVRFDRQTLNPLSGIGSSNPASAKLGVRTAMCGKITRQSRFKETTLAMSAGCPNRSSGGNLSEATVRVRHCSQHAGANVDFGDEGAVDWALLGNLKQLRALLLG